VALTITCLGCSIGCGKVLSHHECGTLKAGIYCILYLALAFVDRWAASTVLYICIIGTLHAHDC
jgi:hypothetical protein